MVSVGRLEEFQDSAERKHEELLPLVQIPETLTLLCRVGLEVSADTGCQV